MASTSEQLEFIWSLDYKQLKIVRKEWLQSDIFYASNTQTSWRLQLDNSDSTKLSVYVTLINGAPCTLRNYTLSMLTNSNPPLPVFTNQCTRQRSFPCNNFSWGFANFCTRNELKSERYLICDRKTKRIQIRGTMNIKLEASFTTEEDHYLATNFFHTRPLETWIDLLKERYDLPELMNRVNEEIETRLS